MTKSTPIILALALLIACAPRPKKPNIVLVITDDQGYGDLSVYGSPDVHTPNLDKLHEQGLAFHEKYYVQEKNGEILDWVR